MEVEDIIEENIDEEAAVNEELRTLAFPEISSQINVLSLNNHVQEIYADSKIRPNIYPENLATLVRSLNLKQKTILKHIFHIAKKMLVFMSS